MVIFAGVALVVVGAILMAGQQFGLGRLPGDIAYRRGDFGCYFPLMTSILISLLLSAILWFFRR